MTQASATGELMAQANSFAKRFGGSRYWPDRQWDLVLPLSNSAQRSDGYDELLERTSWFYEAVTFSAAMKSQTPGKGQQRGDRGARNEDLRREADGSVNLYFGRTAPAGRESNWVQTIPGRHWFCYVRFYGPLEPYFDRFWKLGDIHPGIWLEPPRPRRGSAS